MAGRARRVPQVGLMRTRADPDVERLGSEDGGLVTLGYRSALVCGTGAVGYGVASILVGLLAPSAIDWEGMERFAADYQALPTVVLVTPPLVVALAFPLLVLAASAKVAGPRRPLASLALAFAGITTAVLGAAYWIQLTYVPWNILRGTTEGLAPWVMWNPASFFWPLETFGYFAMGTASLLLGLAFRRTEIPRRLRRGLLAMGALGAYFMLVALKDLVLSITLGEPWTSGVEALATAMALSAAFAWVLLFGFVSFSLARWFAGLRPAG